jgi:hypothetical protein
MSINVTCGACDKRYVLPDKLAGRKAKCKKCGQMIEIPAANVEAADNLGLPGDGELADESPGTGCPICESPVVDGVCSVCGYSDQASKTLTKAPVAAGAKPRAKRGGKSSDSGEKPRSSSSALSSRLLMIGSVAIVVILVVGSFGLFIGAMRAEQKKEDSHERLFALLEYLAEQRQASFDGADIDPDDLMKEGAAKFAAELPHVPSFIAIIEPKKSMLAEDSKRWVIDLIKNLPAGTDLAPLDEIPANSFASAAVKERREKG